MAKRTSGQFPRRKNDTYDTPAHAVEPLLRFLPPKTLYVEPCAGKGDLVKHLEAAGHICTGAYDVDPRERDDDWKSEYLQSSGGIIKRDALQFKADKHYYPVDMIITNPPWTRDILHQLIMHFYWQRPTWMLFDAAWAYTLQSQPYMPLVSKIVSVGRVKWMEGSKDKGKDDCAWYLFEGKRSTEFFGR